jgi:1,4-alpha-glucan branching enzyme
MHAGVQRWVTDLNRSLRAEPALFERDHDPSGFAWAIGDDDAHSTLSFLRYGADGAPLLFVANFTPVVRPSTRVPVPRGGYWRELLNSDAHVYGGSGVGNLGGVDAHPAPLKDHAWSLTMTLPPLGVLFFAPT